MDDNNLRFSCYYICMHISCSVHSESANLSPSPTVNSIGSGECMYFYSSFCTSSPLALQENIMVVSDTSVVDGYWLCLYIYNYVHGSIHTIANASTGILHFSLFMPSSLQRVHQHLLVIVLLHHLFIPLLPTVSTRSYLYACIAVGHITVNLFTCVNVTELAKFYCWYTSH